VKLARRSALVAVVVAIASLLAACGGGGGGGSVAVPPPFENVGRTESFSVLSASTAFNYPITVYLPPQYDENTQSKLPVIFAVDGDATFGYPLNVTRFEALKQEMQLHRTAAILVGVGGTARRNTDFLPPGSVPYHQFLTQELVPRIDAQYRTDTGMRILSGLSYGGTITFLAFTYEGAGNATFKQFWSTETAQPNGMGFVLFDAEAAMASAVQTRPVPVTLFFAGSPGANGPYVDSLYAQVASRHYTGLDLEHASYATTHVGADIPAFDEALARFIH
jgi:hypothetical protein